MENNEWKEAVIETLMVLEIYSNEHEENPRKAIHDIQVWNWKAAEYFCKKNLTSHAEVV